MVLTPDFDLVIVTAGDQESSTGVDGDTSDRAFIWKYQRGCSVPLGKNENTFMLLESVYQDTHAVVP